MIDLEMTKAATNRWRQPPFPLAGGCCVGAVAGCLHAKPFLGSYRTFACKQLPTAFPIIAQRIATEPSLPQKTARTSENSPCGSGRSTAIRHFNHAPAHLSVTAALATEQQNADEKDSNLTDLRNQRIAGPTGRTRKELNSTRRNSYQHFLIRLFQRLAFSQPIYPFFLLNVRIKIIHPRRS